MPPSQSRPEHTFTLARYMGTSEEQISTTYGHLLPGSFEEERKRMDAFDAKSEAFGQPVATPSEGFTYTEREKPCTSGAFL
jgi:hypothetical protein